MKKNLMGSVIVVGLCAIASSIRSEDAAQPKSWRDRLYDTASSVGNSIYSGVSRVGSSVSSGASKVGRQFGLGDYPGEYEQTKYIDPKTTERGYPTYRYFPTYIHDDNRPDVYVQPGSAVPQEVLQKDFERTHDVAKHKGRYEGATNVVLGAAAAYGTYLVGKSLYSWYRGPLHHIKSELQALKDKTQKLINYVAEHSKKTSSHRMKIILGDAINNQNGILSLQNCTKIFHQLREAINNQEDRDKKNKDVDTKAETQKPQFMPGKYLGSFELKN